MAGIDFSNYQNNKKARFDPLSGANFAADKKRNFIYLAIIAFCLAVLFLVFKNNIFPNRMSVGETLPPGVPLEAPPLELMPAAGK